MSSEPPVTPNIQNLITKNAQHVKNLTQQERDLPIPPAKKYAIVTCMDARIHPSKAFGITLGDAHIIRNAGASGVDALRSLVISQQLLGTEEVFIVKHTDCGMLKFDNSHLRNLVKERLNTDAAKDIDFLFYPDLEQSVRDDVAYLKGTGLLPEEVVISGWVYEVETGKCVRIV
ncbi:carbonic anhydrase [Ascobolus immersus RN42]|uniref:Carbonic anhydrase n=1 Tax=Ascobolus immersus RN42 TaxID=1160509 RepID=A0A3N4IEE8_ASCIM|nr:carbonic anhydrase [Ascobolus immersus RN42]